MPTIALSGTNGEAATWTRARNIAVTIGNDPTAVGWCLIEDSVIAPSSASCKGAAWATVRPTAFSLAGAEGERRVNVWLLFRDGRISSHGSGTINLDLSAPVQSVTSPAADVIVTPSVAMTVTCEIGRNLVIGGDASALTVPCDASPTTFNAILKSPDGAKTVSIQQTDAAGNVGGITFSLVRDDILPVAPVIGSPSGNIFAVAGRVVWTWTSGEITTNLDIGADRYHYQLYHAANCSGEIVAFGATPESTHSVMGLTNGVSVSLSVREIDAAGNFSAVTCLPTVTTDFNASLAISEATAHAGYARQVGINAAVSNDEGAVAWCLRDTLSTQPAIDDCAGGAWPTIRPTSMTLSNSEGEKTAYLWLKDAFDNITTTAAVDNIILDTIAPDLSIETPVANQWVPGGQQVMITCEIGTQLSYKFSAETTVIGSCTESPLAVSPDWPTVDGAKTFTIVSEDAAGNSTETNRTFNIDREGPLAFNVTSPANHIYTAAAQHTFGFSASDTGAGLATTDTYQVHIYHNADCTAPASSQITVLNSNTPIDIPADTTVTIIAKAFDKLGHSHDSACSHPVTRYVTPFQTFIGDENSGTYTALSPTIGLTTTGFPPSGFSVCYLATATLPTQPAEGTCTGSSWGALQSSLDLPNGTIEGERLVSVWFRSSNVTLQPVTRLVNLDLPSVITFTNPAVNSWHKNTADVTLNCQYMQEGDTITFSSDVQSTTAVCTEGIATATLTFTANDGVKSVMASHTDFHNRTSTTTRSFQKDTNPPNVEITGPEANYLSNLDGSIDLEVTCEPQLNVSIYGDVATDTKMCPEEGILIHRIYLSQPDGQRTVNVKQVDLAGNETTNTRIFERFFARIMVRNIMIDPNTPKQFYMEIQAADPIDWVYSFTEGVTADKSTTTENNGLIEIPDPINAPTIFLYSPAQDYIGADSVVVWAQNAQGRRVSGEILFEVDDSLSVIQPVLSIRATGCMMCHAQINASMVTDFGYGSPYFGGAGSFNSGQFYGDHDRNSNWSTAKIQGKLIVPRTTSIPDYYNTSLFRYLRDWAGTNANFPTKVAAEPLIYIGAPTVERLREVSGIHAGDAIKTTFFKNDHDSQPLSGLNHNSVTDYYHNTPGTRLVCYGDLVVDGVLFLEDLEVETDNAGCRIYATQSIFLQGSVNYTILPIGEVDPEQATNPDRNLQLSSARSVNLGLGSVRNPGPGATGNCHGGSNISGHVSSHIDRYNHGGFTNNMYTRVTGFDQSKVVINNNEIIAQGNRIANLRDAWCYGQMTSLERILINAPNVQSRYKENVKGMVVSEVALFALGSFTFEYDPAFNGKSLLPLLSRNDWIKLGTDNSNNASIHRIDFGGASLTPQFSHAVTNYSAVFQNATTSITAKAYVDEDGATVAVNGSPLAWGVASEAINLEVGPNTVTFVGTAEDQATTKTYTFIAHRLPLDNDASLSALDISSGSLTPEFDPGITSYEVTVDYDTTSITLTPKLFAVTKHFTVNGSSNYISGTTTPAYGLNIGSNVFYIVMTAIDNSSHETYIISVTRESDPEL